MQRFTSHLRGQEENGLYRAQSKKEKTEIGFERIIRALFGIVNDSSHRIFSSGVRVFVHPTDSSFCSDLSTNKVEQATLSRLFSFCSVALDGSNGNSEVFGSRPKTEPAGNLLVGDLFILMDYTTQYICLLKMLTLADKSFRIVS